MRNLILVLLLALVGGCESAKEPDTNCRVVAEIVSSEDDGKLREKYPHEAHIADFFEEGEMDYVLTYLSCRNEFR